MASALGDVLKAARSAAGLTQAEFAERLGISRAAVGQWEAGVHEPSTDNLIRACRMLGVDVDAAIAGQMKRTSGEATERFKSPDKLTALSGFKLMAGLSRSLYKDTPDYFEKSVPLYLCHSYPGESHIFISNEELARAPKLLMLQAKKGVYAINMPDKRLFPLYDESQTIYIDPLSKFGIYDFVVVRTSDVSELKSEYEGDGIPAEKCYIGRVIGYDLFGIKLQQFNPDRAINVPMTATSVVHRIPTTAELIPTVP